MEEQLENDESEDGDMMNTTDQRTRVAPLTRPRIPMSRRIRTHTDKQLADSTSLWASEPTVSVTEVCRNASI